MPRLLLGGFGFFSLGNLEPQNCKKGTPQRPSYKGSKALGLRLRVKGYVGGCVLCGWRFKLRGGFRYLGLGSSALGLRSL